MCLERCSRKYNAETLKNVIVKNVKERYMYVQQSNHKKKLNMQLQQSTPIFVPFTSINYS